MTFDNCMFRSLSCSPDDCITCDFYRNDDTKKICSYCGQEFHEYRHGDGCTKCGAPKDSETSDGDFIVPLGFPDEPYPFLMEGCIRVNDHNIHLSGFESAATSFDKTADAIIKFADELGKIFK